MGIPQYILIALTLYGMWVNTTKHGQTKTTETYGQPDYWLSVIMLYGILFWGGFFDV